MLANIKNVFKIEDLRNKILFTFMIVALYRVGAAIRVPGVDPVAIDQLREGAQNGALGLFNLFSGGAFESFSIFALGIMPYITASIIMQVLGVVIPKLEELQQQGAVGQRKITQTLFEKFLPNRVDMQILDIGAGTGGQLRQLRQWGEVTSFDFMEMACRFFAQRDSRRIAVASAAAMPFKDEAFDLATIFDVYATLDDADEAAALKETARVLKPGGFLFWREPGHMPTGFSRKEIS